MEIHDKLKDLKTLDTAAISDALDSLNIKGERLDIARETFNYSHAWEDKDEIF